MRAGQVPGAAQERRIPQDCVAACTGRDRLSFPFLDAIRVGGEDALSQHVFTGDSQPPRRARRRSSASQAQRMEEQSYLINGRIFAAHNPGLQEALARIYGTPARPRCLCVDEGVEMYVSKFGDFVIKRMPETGAEHRPTCPSYELGASESGLGEVLGEAIIERGTDGVELRLAFPLTRRIGRCFATAD